MVFDGRVPSASGAGATEVRVALDEVVVAAAAAIAGADHAGLTVVTDGTIRCLGATDVQPIVLANIARRCRQGPYFGLVADRRPVRVDDLTRDPRWPVFASEAASSSPVRALLAQTVFHDGDSCAVFTLYADTAGAFGARTAVDCSPFASRLAQILSAAQHAGTTPAPGECGVDRARELLMRRFSVDDDEAQAMLERMAAEQDRTVEDVAVAVVSGREGNARSAKPAGDQAWHAGMGAQRIGHDVGPAGP